MVRASVVAAVIAALVAAPVAGIVDVPEASAQVWKPKKKPAVKKKPATKKKKKARKKTPRPDRIIDTEVPDEPADFGPTGPAPEPEPESDEDDSGVEDEDEDADEDEDEDDEDTSEDGDSERIEDDLDDVGADVTFSEADLRSDATDGSGTTRLETKALGYGRLGVDTIHDPPPAVDGGRTGTGEDVLAFRAHGRAESTSRFGQRLKVKIAGRADAEIGLDSDTQVGIERYEAEIWDTYADAYLDNLDLRFGRQIVAWGTADLLSPNDVVNPRDLRRGFLVEVDDLRRPVLALSATTYTGPLSLQALWIPVAPANRFDLLDGDYALLGPHAATESEARIGALVSALADDPSLGLAVSPILAIGAPPDNGIESGELGAQGSIETRRFDVHGYFLLGHERNPRIRLADDLRDFLVMTPPEMLTPMALAERISLLGQMGIVPVEVDYPRRVHAGFAMATRLEPVGIKLDAAYVPRTNTILVTPGAGPVLGEAKRLPQASGTLSIDYDRGTEMSVVLEVSHTRVLKVPDGQQVFQMAKRDQLTVIGGRLSWNPGGGPVTVSGLGFVDVDAPSYAVRPALELSGHDHWSVEIAATLYGGPEGSFGGVADDADEVTLTVQYGL